MDKVLHPSSPSKAFPVIEHRNCCLVDIAVENPSNVQLVPKALERLRSIYIDGETVFHLDTFRKYSHFLIG